MDPDDSGTPRTVTVRGISSTVTLDLEAGTASKVYRQRRPIRWLYWLAYQAPFPYATSLAALKASKYRRRIAGIVTHFYLGRDIVAPVVAVRRFDDHFEFVTELVAGREPADHRKARRFLHDVCAAFIETGLPTWQVTPHNPRAVGNLIEVGEDDYRIIDLESNVVTPMVPLSELWGAARTGHLPPFDDIDIPRLVQWTDRHKQEIHARLGKEAYDELVTSIAKYIWYERLWQGAEPRAWSRGLSRFARFIDVPAHLRALRRRIDRWSESARVRAEDWVRSRIDAWRVNGRITEAEADAASVGLGTTDTITAMGHLGAHIAISIPLRFPLGAITRFTWVVAFRTAAEVRALVRRGADDATRRARSIHTPLVAAAAALPGAGAAAYVLADPFRKNRVLLAATLDGAWSLLPFSLYRRLHLGEVTSDLARPDPADRPRLLSQFRSGLGDLRRHWLALLALLALNIAVVGGAGLYWAAAEDGIGFSDFGAVSVLKVSQVAMAGLIGILIYRKFWSTGDEDRPGAGGILFWLASGIALIWLAIDDYFEVHGTLGGLISTLPIIEHVGHLALLVYGIAAMLLVRLFLREVSTSPPVFALLAMAMGAALITLLLDVTIDGSSDYDRVEEPFHVAAAMLILMTFGWKYSDVARTARAEELKDVPIDGA